MTNRGAAFGGMLLLLAAGGTAAGQGNESPVRVDANQAVQTCLTPAERSGAVTNLNPARMRRVIACVNAASARQINAQLPVQIDDVTRLDRVTTQGTELTYHYSVARRARDLPARFRPAIEQSTRGHVCGEPQMVQTMRRGGVYAYRWVDANGVPIHQIRITGC